jgi:hypothetical protein
MEKWQLETAERLASIERSIKYIEVNLTNLPPSPACIAADVKLEKRVEMLEEFKKQVLIRVAWVSGAFAVITSGLFSALDSIKMFFKTL